MHHARESRRTQLPTAMKLERTRAPAETANTRTLLFIVLGGKEEIQLSFIAKFSEEHGLET